MSKYFFKVDKYNFPGDFKKVFTQKKNVINEFGDAVLVNIMLIFNKFTYFSYFRL